MGINYKSYDYSIFIDLVLFVCRSSILDGLIQRGSVPEVSLDCPGHFLASTPRNPGG